MDQPVVSPVTGGAAFLCDQFVSRDIIERYRDDWGLDVAEHFAGRHSLSLYQCKDTGYRFFHPPSLAGEASFYDQFWALENPTVHRPTDAGRNDWQFALERIGSGQRILDVGAADGAFVQRAGEIASAEGIDENEAGCRIAQAKGLKVSCAPVGSFADANPEAFDFVVASQVLEHVYDVAGFMTALKRLVKPAGRVIVSVPNNQPYYVGWAKYEPLNNPPHHIGLWNEASLRAMAKELGFTVQEVGFLGEPARFTVQVFRRAAFLTKVSRAPRQLRPADWARIAIAAPIALVGALFERVTHSTSRYAYLGVVLQKA